MQKLRPNSQRAKNAILLIWIALVIDIISLISSYLQYDLLQSALNGASISMEAATANDSRERMIAIIEIIVAIIAAVTFIQWFRRAYYNLHQKLDYLSHPEGWAAGAWFVPIMHLYRPYQIMVELYRETKELLSKYTSTDHRFSLSTNIIGVWWAIWIITNILGNIVFRLSLRAETADEFLRATTISMVHGVFSIPLAFLAVKVIKDYSKVEPTLLELNDDDPFPDFGKPVVDDDVPPTY
ncbi:hypothetical protein BKI52_28130 [marine bacterium AO1-C]|nr:hypothetical protein BKI52_28130 [marine bacterium AO1-C]